MIALNPASTAGPAHSPAPRFRELQIALAGQYHFERELGSGGMGVVMLARDVRLDRLVAIKVLPTTAEEDPLLYSRFLREARTAGQLSHPNIVPVFRADDLGGHAFFAMPFVDGSDLGTLIERHRVITPIDVARWMRQVAWALAYAHARGVVHRDIKPENIVVERESRRALVTDFGLARSIARAPESAGEMLDARHTAEGMIVGSAHYMSPEQILDDGVDGRSDLYSLGAVAFHAITGRTPFAGTVPAILTAHLERRAPPVGDLAPVVPTHIAAVVDRCLAKHPSDRYETGEALADALEKAIRLTTVKSTTARPGGSVRVRLRGIRRGLARIEQLASAVANRVYGAR